MLWDKKNALEWAYGAASSTALALVRLPRLLADQTPQSTAHLDENGLELVWAASVDAPCHYVA